jgi:hypothetical protein
MTLDLVQIVALSGLLACLVVGGYIFVAEMVRIRRISRRHRAMFSPASFVELIEPSDDPDVWGDWLWLG